MQLEFMITLDLMAFLDLVRLKLRSPMALLPFRPPFLPAICQTGGKSKYIFFLLFYARNLKLFHSFFSMILVGGFLAVFLLLRITRSTTGQHLVAQHSMVEARILGLTWLKTTAKSYQWEEWRSQRIIWIRIRIRTRTRTRTTMRIRIIDEW